MVNGLRSVPNARTALPSTLTNLPGGKGSFGLASSGRGTESITSPPSIMLACTKRASRIQSVPHSGPGGGPGGSVPRSWASDGEMKITAIRSANLRLAMGDSFGIGHLMLNDDLQQFDG